MKRPARGPDPGEASLPEGWESLSYYSRRELMRGARIPPPGEGLTRGPLPGEQQPEDPEATDRPARPRKRKA